MEWLNYHHLLYFWTVAKEGSISKASGKLRLAQPTISAQIHTLEEALGEKLFQRVGRNLVLTDVGRTVFGYADEIFTLGRELLDVVKNRPTGRPLTLTVGVVDVVPKLIAYRLLEPALQLPEKVHVVIKEDRLDELLGQLSVHQLDLVIADAPVPQQVRVRAFSHKLGDCGVHFHAAPKLHAQLSKKPFPQCLDGAPVLLPAKGTSLRRALDTWFEEVNIRPTITAEFDDTALMKVFGQAGEGAFCLPSVIRKEIEEQYNVRPLGDVEQVRESFYAISVERRIKHPAVVAITRTARKELFG